MNITDGMIHAGVKKALALGLLPRKSVVEDIATNCELMEEILREVIASTESDMPASTGTANRPLARSAYDEAA